MFHKDPKARGKGMLVVSVILFVGLLVVSRRFEKDKAPHAAPEAFRYKSMAAMASDPAARAEFPVLVLVSADWCAPCTQLKQGPLADRSVTEWIRQTTRPVLLDATHDNPEVANLKVFSIPTFLVLRDGNEVARLEGYHDAAELRAWLTTVTGPVADWKYQNPGQELPVSPGG